MTYCLSGSTIRIEVVFKDFNNELVDPSNIKLVIYDKDYKQVGTDITDLIKKSAGTWYYDYETPLIKKDKLYYCEISGDVGTKTIVVRSSFTTRFVLGNENEQDC